MNENQTQKQSLRWAGIAIGTFSRLPPNAGQPAIPHRFIEKTSFIANCFNFPLMDFSFFEQQVQRLAPQEA